jgi:hypothetical protein
MQNLFPASATNSTECEDEQTVAMEVQLCNNEVCYTRPKVEADVGSSSLIISLGWLKYNSKQCLVKTID